MKLMMKLGRGKGWWTPLQLNHLGGVLGRIISLQNLSQNGVLIVTDFFHQFLSSKRIWLRGDVHHSTWRALDVMQLFSMLPTDVDMSRIAVWLILLEMLSVAIFAMTHLPDRMPFQGISIRGDAKAADELKRLIYFILLCHIIFTTSYFWWKEGKKGEGHIKVSFSLL